MATVVPSLTTMLSVSRMNRKVKVQVSIHTLVLLFRSEYYRLSSVDLLSRYRMFQPTATEDRIYTRQTVVILRSDTSASGLCRSVGNFPDPLIPSSPHSGPGALSLGAKRAECEYGHFPSSDVKFKN
jgi:hypothetical protein